MAEDVKYVEGLIIAAGETAPRIIRIPYTEEDDIEWPFSNTASHKLDHSAWFGAGHHVVEKELKRDSCTGRSLSQTLVVLHENTAGSENEPGRQCVDILTGSQCRNWRGTIVVVRAVEPTSTLTQYQSATMDDFEPVKAWLNS